MKINENTVDRVIRVVLGLGILSLVFWGPQTYWGLLGIIPLATGLVGWCGIYAACGLSTKK
jgi:hypothetical protein